jgi:hypothetical protein
MYPIKDNLLIKGLNGPALIALLSLYGRVVLLLNNFTDTF